MVIWIMAWTIFCGMGWVGIATVELATAPSKPVIVTHLSHECLSHAAESGRVSFFREDKGYGFIHPDKIGSDVFVHINELHRSGLTSLQDGQAIGYTVLTYNNKPYAVDFCS